MPDWAGRPATRIPPEGFSLTDAPYPSLGEVRRPEGWGAVEIGVVTVLWEPATDKDDYQALDKKRIDIEGKYTAIQADAGREHEVAVARAEERLAEAKREIVVAQEDGTFQEGGTSGDAREQRRRDAALADAERAYEVDILAADDALVLKAWPAGREMEREIASSIGVMFKVPPDRFVVYRSDLDSWAEADTVGEATELATVAIEEHKAYGQSMIEGISRAQRAGRAGAIVARYPRPPEPQPTPDEARQRLRKFLREHPGDIEVHEYPRLPPSRYPQENR